MNEIIDFSALAGQIGSMGTFVLIFMIAFWYMKGKNKPSDLSEMKAQIKDLHEWHSVVDKDGVKIWYVRSSLESAVSDMTKAIQTMTDAWKDNSLLMKHLVEEIKLLRGEVRK